jgi:hypothetical protein
MWHIHRKEYHSTLRNKKILPPATMWMNLEDIYAKLDKLVTRQIPHDTLI